MTNKTFIFGVGAQKAGTSWLHSYLASQAYADFGFRKEYHVFDAIESPSGRFYKRAQLRASKAAESHSACHARQSNALIHFEFMSNPQSYFAYFKNLLANGEALLTGDITPNYSGLSVNTLRMVKNGFLGADISFLPVFILRDPVYRLYSQAQMHLKKSNQFNAMDSSSEYRLMEEWLSNPRVVGRIDYSKTLDNLFNAFEPDSVFVDFYEKMFTDDFRERLSAVLGLTLSDPPTKSYVNKSKRSNQIDADRYEYFKGRLIRNWYNVQELTGFDTFSFWTFESSCENKLSPPPSHDMPPQ